MLRKLWNKLSKKSSMLQILGLLIIISGFGTFAILKSRQSRNLQGSSFGQQSIQQDTSEQKTDSTTVQPTQPPSTTEDKKASVTSKQSTTPQTATVAEPNPYEVGFSAWYVFNRRAELGKKMPNSSEKVGDQSRYCPKLTAASYPTTNTPKLYHVACTARHVAFVEKLNEDGTFWVSEMNATGQKSMTDTTAWGGWYHVDYRLIPTNQLSGWFFAD